MSPGRLDSVWYGPPQPALAAFLVPLSWLFCAAVWLRRQAYRLGLARSAGVPAPVIVVGNISLGGTGKTPLVIWLVEYLRSRGFRPGVVCRGYRGGARHWPQQVRPDSDPVSVGDEPVVIARRTGCPVAAGPRRHEAASAMLAHTDCDLIICDDGLQHLALERDIEIAVIDGIRRHGNGHCLPAGPLRERPSRLDEVDMIVSSGRPGRGEFTMMYRPVRCQNLASDSAFRSLDDFVGQTVHAVAGIGNPEKFFRQLEKKGIDVIRHGFPDHHAFTPGDLAFDDGMPVIMTEKDGVKCRRFAREHWWFVMIEAVMPDTFARRLDRLLEQVARKQR